MRFLVALTVVIGATVWAQYASQTPAPSAGYEQAAAPPPPAAPAKPAGGYEAPAAPPPAAGYEASEAAGAADEDKGNKFPVDSCYINKDGFLCCSSELEQLMRDTYDKLAASRGGKWKKCNIHQVTLAVQKACEGHFNHPFEVVTGAGDYASKNNFDKDLICKIKRERS